MMLTEPGGDGVIDASCPLLLACGFGFSADAAPLLLLTAKLGLFETIKPITVVRRRSRRELKSFLFSFSFTLLHRPASIQPSSFHQQHSPTNDKRD
jgi:hypothetical protein